ncbi:MAG TPA: PAS domain S-box protein [Bacteroidales bacterium]|nr:PAS domain S-box protein [Bacteroidales bacterium]
MALKKSLKHENDLLAENTRRIEEIKSLNEKLTLINEELIITNEELKSYKNKLEDLVSIRTSELQKKEEYLKYKNDIERFLSGISTQFFNLSPDSVDTYINHSLGEICRFFHAEAAFLGEILYSENAYAVTHVWNTTEIKYNSQYFKKAPLSDIIWWLDKINSQDVFTVDYKNNTGNSYSLQNTQHLSGTGIINFIPIIFQGNIVGFIGLSSYSVYRWTEDETILLHQLGEVFFNALKRKESEKYLIVNERNYREIFNATNEAIIIYDYHNSQIIDINQAAVKLFDLTYEEAFEGKIDNLSNTDLGFNREKLMIQIEKTIRDGPVVFEWQIKRKNGHLIWTEVSLKNTEIAGDLRIIAVVRDISDRKQSQEMIMQSEERFRSIIQFLTDIIFIIKEDLTISYESPSCAKVLGFPAQSLIGMRSLDLIHPEDKNLVLHDLQEVFENRNDFKPTEFRVKSFDRDWISLEVIANNMLHHPAIQGIIVTGRDVTERRKVEKALNISETKFRNIFNNTSDPIVIISNKYDFLEVNEVFLNATNYTQAEMKNMKFTEIITDPYLPQMVDNLVHIFRNDHQPALECEIKCRGKRTFPAEINSKLIEFEGEHALISVIRNITERKQMESRILDTIISTEEREREKFARNLHDDLGPLLSSIKMYVNSLSSSIDKTKHDFVTSQLKIILKEVIQSTKELSNDLSPHVLTNYGLIAALEWYINQLKPYISISFETNLREERFPTSLELSVYRIIKELMNNTIKHAKANKITIRLHLILKSLHLHYHDNGIGFNNWQDGYEFMGMGMSNIISRCRSINATNKFFNNAPNGMAFEMVVPVEEQKATV